MPFAARQATPRPALLEMTSPRLAVPVRGPSRGGPAHPSLVGARARARGHETGYPVVELAVVDARHPGGTHNQWAAQPRRVAPSAWCGVLAPRRDSDLRPAPCPRSARRTTLTSKQVRARLCVREACLAAAVCGAELSVRAQLAGLQSANGLRQLHVGKHVDSQCVRGMPLCPGSILYNDMVLLRAEDRDNALGPGASAARR